MHVIDWALRSKREWGKQESRGEGIKQGCGLSWRLATAQSHRELWSMNCAAELICLGAPGWAFLNSRSVSHGIQDALGEGCAQSGLSGWSGSCLRAILPQGRCEPSSQYSQHLGDGCIGLVRGGPDWMHQWSPFQWSGWRMQSGNWIKWVYQDCFYVAWGWLSWQKDAEETHPNVTQDISTWFLTEILATSRIPTSPQSLSYYATIQRWGACSSHL